MNFSNIKADCISSENAAIRFICRTALIYQLVFGWTVREEFWIGFKGISISSLQYTPEKSYENKHQLWDTVWELEIQPWIRNIFRAEFQTTFIICSIWINYIQFMGSFMGSWAHSWAHSWARRLVTVTFIRFIIVCNVSTAKNWKRYFPKFIPACSS